MTKNNKRIIFSVSVIAVTSSLMVFFPRENALKQVSDAEPTHSRPQLENTFKTDYRPATTGLVNAGKALRKPASQLPAPLWKSNLEKSLQTQANGRLKSSEITKVDSFSWKVGKVDVPVESLFIKLVDVGGQTTTFRAMVDSTNGKVLQTWDHPQDDNFDGQNHDGISVDARYHND